MTVYGDGSQTRSFCFVDDLVNGLYGLLGSDYQEPVNLGNPAEMTILQLAEAIRELTGSQSEILRLAERRGASDPQRRQPDIQRAQTVLNWSPTVNLEDGLRRTIEDFEARL